MTKQITAEDPIVAIATAQGRGGVGIVRISGKDLTGYARLLILPEGKTLPPRQAIFCGFQDDQGTLLDQGLALYFAAPHSFTGENVLELHAHGSPALLELLVQSAIKLGARLAEPGEFSKRAFLNGKIDLAQAEAVADLIEATTATAAKAAARSLTGVFSKQINLLVDRITYLRMQVEATLDFPEEEIDFLKQYQAQEQLNHLQEQIAATLTQAKTGALLRRGLHIVLIGEPNVGKSSLLNCLAGQELAIVTPIPGTTRDPVRQDLEIQGIPVRVIDTAGLRTTEDIVEKVGIERTWEAIQQADLAIVLQEAPKSLSGKQEITHPSFVESLPPELPCLWVYNKIDLVSDFSEKVARNQLNTSLSCLWISAKTGEGIPALEREILSMVGWQGQEAATFLARERQVAALQAAAAALQQAEQQSASLELLAEELRLAQEALCTITGAFTADDLLGKIFSQFCIGK